MTRRRLLVAVLAAIVGGWVALRRWPAEGPAPPLLAEPSTTTMTRGTPPTTPAKTVTAAPTTAPPPPLSLVSRSAWEAAAPTGPYLSHRIERLTVHHTAVVTSEGEGAGAVRSVQSFHQGPERGWVDIAYHLLIDREGNVYEGRPFGAPGDTATSYDPAGHFLPCLLGDFDRQEPTLQQLDALVDVLAWGVVTFGVGIDTLGGHRDYAQTSCPGESVYALIEDGALVTAVEERLPPSARQQRIP